MEIGRFEEVVTDSKILDVCKKLSKADKETLVFQICFMTNI